MTTLLGREAVSYIAQQDGSKPFFMYLTFTAPHAPYQAPQQYLDQYPDTQDTFKRSYDAMITAMDEQIGNILAELDRRGWRDNTLIVFQSDNGGPRSAEMTGEVDTSGGKIPADNGPYRDGKGSFYEGGTRVAALAHWRGHIQPAVVDQPLHIVDMYPTLVKLAGGTMAKAKPLDGLDAWPTISRGEPSPRTEVVYGIEPFRAAVRQGDFKLVWKTSLPSSVELFDIAKDPYETTNLADKYPEKVAALKQRSESLAREAAPPMLMKEIKGVSMSTLFGSVALPEERHDMEQVP